MSRDYNRVAVLRLIVTSGPIARVQIAKTLGLSPATVTAVTRELLDQGIVRVAERAPSKGGRPALLLELVGGAATAFGVKIAPDHLVGVRVDLEGRCSSSTRRRSTYGGRRDRADDEMLWRWIRRVGDRRCSVSASACRRLRR